MRIQIRESEILFIFDLIESNSVIVEFSLFNHHVYLPEKSMIQCEFYSKESKGCRMLFQTD